MKTKIVSTIIFLTFIAVISPHDLGNILQQGNLQSFDNSASSDINSQIIHGREAQPHSHPYMAGLLVTMPSSSGVTWTTVNGGSLLSDSFVLTTAWSLRGSLHTLVILGAHRLFAVESSQQRIYVQRDEYIIHPEYVSSHFQNDIALLRLPHRAVFNKYVQPIKLPSEKLLDYDFVNESVQVTGWGRFTDSSGTSSEFLRVAENKVITNSVCSKYFTVFVGSDTLCTETHQSISATCRGDNGSPVTYKENEQSERVLVGAVSFGVWIFNFGCDPIGHNFRPNANTRITKFVPWILQNIFE